MSNNKWTATDIPDLSGKVMVVTGANVGLGFETAKELARKGARTVMACRNLQKAQTAADRILAEIPDAQIEVIQLDLASQRSIRQFVDEFKADHDRLDVLANNAGIMWTDYAKTEDGFESQFGTNHLGHFALTGLLLDRLLATPGSRVVNVSSMGHRSGAMDFDNLMFDGGKDYSRHGAYGRSKLANLLFTYELQRRYEAIGADALAVAAHPGGSNTDLGRHVQGEWYMRFLWPVVNLMAQSAAQGALPTLRAAVDPAAEGGQYYGPGGFMETRGDPVLVESSQASHSVADAQKLWAISEELTGVTYAALALP